MRDDRTHQNPRGRRRARLRALIRQRFRNRIRKGDLDFRFARHGEEALEVLQGEPDIGLLLLDINMPVMDGLTLLERAARSLLARARGDSVRLR